MRKINSTSFRESLTQSLSLKELFPHLVFWLTVFQGRFFNAVVSRFYKNFVCVLPQYFLGILAQIWVKPQASANSMCLCEGSEANQSVGSLYLRVFRYLTIVPFQSSGILKWVTWWSLTQVLESGAVSGFSGQKLYNDILYQFYNVARLSLGSCSFDIQCCNRIATMSRWGLRLFFSGLEKCKNHHHES